MNKEYQLMLTRDELIAVTSATLMTEMLLQKQAEEEKDADKSKHFNALLSAQRKLLEMVTDANEDFKGMNAA